MCADGATFSEPRGVTNGRHEGQRRQSAYTWNLPQLLYDRILFCRDLLDLFIVDCDLVGQPWNYLEKPFQIT
jgi:hypothetical protein